MNPLNLPPGTLKLIPCLPLDTSRLPELPPDVPMFEPSVLHTITQCTVCRQDVWIGPNQKAVGGLVLCYLCLFKTFGADLPEPIALNPDESKIPRRKM